MNVILRMSRHRDQKTLNLPLQSLTLPLQPAKIKQSFTLLKPVSSVLSASSNLAPPSLLLLPLFLPDLLISSHPLALALYLKLSTSFTEDRFPKIEVDIYTESIHKKFREASSKITTLCNAPVSVSSKRHSCPPPCFSLGFWRHTFVIFHLL